MPQTIENFDHAKLTLSDGATPTTVTVDASCQVTNVALTATTSPTTLPGVLCSPGEVDVPAPAKFTLELTFNQDSSIEDGISEFLWNNDAKEGEFELVSLGPDGTSTIAPAVSGRCYFVASNFGGEAGKPLTDTKSLPVIGKPARVFGTASYTPTIAAANGKAAKAAAT